MSSGHCLPKQERLVSRRLIETLFSGSQSVAAFPLRAVYKIKERAREEEPVQLLISVPKKRFHHAVDRNRVKRQVREAYRHNKSLIYPALSDQQQLLLAIVWLSDRHFSTTEVEQRLTTLLKRIAEKL
jgi:ribonuclease P protein component